MAAALALASAPPPASARELTVLHTNDLHSRFDEITVRGSACRPKDRERGKCYGGVARIKKMADQIRDEEGGNVIMLNAGDFFQVNKRRRAESGVGFQKSRKSRTERMMPAEAKSGR